MPTIPPTDEGQHAHDQYRAHDNHRHEDDRQADDASQIRTDGGTDTGNADERPLVQIKMNRRRVEIDDPKPTVKELLIATDRTPPKHFDVFRLDHEGDTEGTKIGLATTIDRTQEQETVFLRAVEKDRNAGR